MNNRWRIWWISPVPGEPLFIPYESREEAKAAIHALALYDEQRIEKGLEDEGLSNVGGVQFWEDGDWEDLGEDE